MSSLFIDVILPTYLLIGLGFLLGKIFKDLETEGISTVVLNVFAPALVFYSFRESKVDFTFVLPVFAVAATVVATGYATSILYGKIKWGKRDRGFEVSTTFMNSGYLGIPLIFLMFGKKAFPYAIAFSVSMTFLHFTVGIMTLNPGSLKDAVLSVLKMPLVHSIILAFFVQDVALPSGIEKMLKMTGTATIPSMLIAIGISLSRIEASHVKVSLVSSLLRFTTGTIGALAAVSIIGGPILFKSVMVVQSSLPSAVLNYVLCDKFKQNPQLAASVIFLSTLVFPVYLFLLKVLLRFTFSYT